MKQYYQLKISISGANPAIWRRILVPTDCTLQTLHTIIQFCFDWESYHLFSFECAGQRLDDETPGALSTSLSRLGLKTKSKFLYVYDFGDDWHHDILVEKIFDDENNKGKLTCVAGKRAGPPEDCGGIWGYKMKLEALNDETHDEHEEILEWMGEDFDPEAFDIDEINSRLADIKC